jgi:PRTRC genetic system ThiF family protein
MMTKEIRHFLPNYLINPTDPVKIMVAGIGGTGCATAANLLKMHLVLKALNHVGLQVHLYDGGIVREANQGRQDFYKDDIGKPKAHVLAERLNAAAGEYIFFPHHKYIAKETLFRGTGTMNTYVPPIANEMNILITCVDTIEARNIFQWVMRDRRRNFDYNRNRGAEHTLYYWLDMGNDFNSAQAILGSKLIHQPDSEGKYITRAKLPTALEFMKDAVARVDDHSSLPSCSMEEAIYSQDLFINSAVADEGCQMLWKLFRNYYITYNAVFINLETGERGRNTL